MVLCYVWTTNKKALVPCAMYCKISVLIGCNSHALLLYVLYAHNGVGIIKLNLIKSNQNEKQK